MNRKCGSGPGIADRAAATACYLIPNPLKGILARRRGDFVQHHLRQAVGLSFLLVCLVALVLVLGLIATGWYIRWEHMAERIHLQNRFHSMVAALVLLWPAAWLSGILLAAGGSVRRLPLAARCGDWRWAYRLGILGGTALGLSASVLVGVAVYAPTCARSLDGAPAALYLLYDETQAPRWVVTLVAFPMNRAANQRWGPGSVIVEPISRPSLREALAHGKIVYLATHGESGPLIYRDGSLGPQDIAQGMPVGSDLRLVYLAACHGGDLADQWKAVLAPAEVVSYPRFSAYVEHAYWLWIRLPRLIAAQN